MTTGELIRELRPFFECSYDLNLAVNEARRDKPTYNWYDAALELLNSLKGNQNGQE